MKKLQKSKKGFTLVELAIVIAVIAILIAVLVPTFISLINSANESADKQMIKNINTTLTTEDAINGINTPSDALDVVADAGYTLEKLTPTSEGNYIVYDQTTKTFALLDSDCNTLYSQNNVTIDAESPSTWWIVSSTSQMTSATRSYILTGDIASTASASTTPSLAKTSVNGGNIAKSTAITISNGKLTYTGFGGLNTYKIDNSEITEIEYVIDSSLAGDYASYYNDNNFVINIGISAAKISISTNIDITIDSHGYEDTIVKVTTTGSATSVTVNDYSGAYYVESSNITVTAAVSSTVKTISEDVYNGATNDTGVLELGNEEYPFLISSESELSKITALSSSMNSGEYYYFELTDDINITSYSKYDGDNYVIKYFRGQLDGNGHDIIVADNSGNASAWYGLIAYLPGDATFVDINIQIPSTGRFNFVGNYFNVSSGRKSGTVTFDNIDTYNRESSSVLYNNSGLLMTNSYAKTLVVKNCDNYATMDGNGNTSGAVWIGQFKMSSTATVTFENCNNYADISGNVIGLFMANALYFTGNYSSADESWLTVTNCHNYGYILGTETAKWFGSGSGSYSVFTQYDNTEINATKDKITGQLAVVTKVTGGLTVDDNSNLVVSTSLIDDANATYVLTYKGEVRTSNGGHTTRTLSFTVSTGTTSYKNAVLIGLVTFESTYSTVSVSSLTKGTDNNGVEYYTYTDSGTIYYIIDAGTDASENTYYVDSTTLTTTVYAYDSYGSLTAYATL